MASSTSVRIAGPTYEVLQKISEDDGRTIQDVIAEAVEALRRMRMIDELNAYYEELWADPVRAAEERAERALWDTTLRDGLEPEPEAV